MHLSGTHTFEGPQELIYRVLTDPNVLRRTLPGCQRFEPRPDGGHDITMSIGIAAIKGVYTGTVHTLNESPPNSYTLKLSAKGGVGFVSGHGDFVLSPAATPTQTTLNYTGEAQVGGKIASVGQRLVQAGANLVIGQFFRAIDKEVKQAAVG